MPVISRFFGIVVYMYWRDHAPPHFHAKYQGDEVIVEIDTGKVTGQISKRAAALIEEWRQLNKQALLHDWSLACDKKRLNAIPPLE